MRKKSHNESILPAIEFLKAHFARVQVVAYCMRSFMPSKMLFPCERLLTSAETTIPSRHDDFG